MLDYGVRNQREGVASLRARLKQSWFGGLRGLSTSKVLLHAYNVGISVLSVLHTLPP